LELRQQDFVPTRQERSGPALSLATTTDLPSVHGINRRRGAWVTGVVVDGVRRLVAASGGGVSFGDGHDRPAARAIHIVRLIVIPPIKRLEKEYPADQRTRWRECDDFMKIYFPGNGMDIQSFSPPCRPWLH
jgi:hypothetical protein